MTTQPLRIVSIGAHPADVFDQCAGTLAHHTARGDHVACVVLTAGSRVHDTVISDEMFHRDRLPERSELEALMGDRSDVKAQEVRAACKILGVEDVYFLGADDAVLLLNEEIVRKLARVLRQLRPDIVLTHWLREGDGVTNDHAITGQIVMKAIQFAGSVDPGDTNPPHRVAQVFYFAEGGAHLRRNLFEGDGGYYVNVYIDTSDVIKKKFAAMECLVSQGYAGAYNRKRMETSDGAFGMSGDSAYAEGFIALRSETHYFLPLAERSLRWSRASDHEIMAHYTHQEEFD